MKVGGEDLRADLDRVDAVRAAPPTHVDLVVDANQRWDLITALRAVKELERLEVQWLEEPLHPDYITGHARLRAPSSVPIALGESIYSAEGFAAFLHAEAVDIVQVDVTRLAGITEWLRIAHHDQQGSLWVVPHAGDMMQVHQHLVGGIGHARIPMIEYLPWWLEMFAEPVKVTSGPSRTFKDARSLREDRLRREIDSNTPSEGDRGQESVTHHPCRLNHLQPFATGRSHQTNSA